MKEKVENAFIKVCQFAFAIIVAIFVLAIIAIVVRVAVVIWTVPVCIS